MPTITITTDNDITTTKCAECGQDICGWLPDPSKAADLLDALANHECPRPKFVWSNPRIFACPHDERDEIIRKVFAHLGRITDPTIVFPDTIEFHLAEQIELTPDEFALIARICQEAEDGAADVERLQATGRM